MARPENVAVAGYVPTPPEQTRRIARLLFLAPQENTWSRDTPTVVDPCAGEGTAVCDLLRHLDTEASVYSCEMETTRHATLQQNLQASTKSHGYSNKACALCGDAFHVTWSGDAGLLWLNPPYGLDREHGRLEERFLDRFHPVLRKGGVLIFIVPNYALDASAETLARHFTDVACWKFTGADFTDARASSDAASGEGPYKRVALIARKSDEAFALDPAVVVQVNRWAEDPSSIPDLPEDLPEGQPPRYEVPVKGYISDWRLRDADLAGLAGHFRPWHESTRSGGLAPLPGHVPDVLLSELFAATYDVATPPRPAHIAVGVAAGIFDGARVEPDDPASKLPPLLVKGVFDREWRRVEEKQNKDGETTAVVEAQRPRLVVTALDLRTGQFQTLRTSQDGVPSDGVPSGNALSGAASSDGAGRGDGDTQAAGGAPATTAAGMSVGDLVRNYGRDLARVMERQCRIRYSPRDAASKLPLPVLDTLGRKLYPPQEHAVRACLELLGGPSAKKHQRRHKTALLLGEVGVGKTQSSLAVARASGARRVLVFCPPHLLDSWRDEVAAVVRGASVRVLSVLSDVDRVLDDPADFVVAVLSRESAKLGHALEAVGPGTGCPRCAAPLPTEDIAKRRSTCSVETHAPADQFSQLVRELALRLRPYAPEDATVRAVLSGRLDRKLAARELPAKEWPDPPEDVLARAADALLEYWSKVSNPGDSLLPALARVLSASGADSLRQRVVSGMVRQEVERKRSAWESTAKHLLLLLQPKSLEQLASLVDLKRGLSNAGSYYGASLDSVDDRIETLAAGDAVSHALPETVSWTHGTLSYGGHAAGTLRASLALLQALAKLGKWQKVGACGERLYQAVPQPRRYPLADYICKRHPCLFDFLIVDEAHEAASDTSAQGMAAHRLHALGMPTVYMTGSVMNGYAESLYANFWSISPKFRAEFPNRDSKGAFVERYGYVKRELRDVDQETKKPVEFGSVTDRVERQERTVGKAPGVMPTFIFRHLLPVAVTLQMEDFDADIPRCTEEPVPIQPTEEQMGHYKRMLEAVKRAIKHDRFDKDRAGKLFGALAELPAYLDLAFRDYEVCYPDSIGGMLVTSAPSLGDGLLPKERWVCDTVRAELAAGFRCMVLVWHKDAVDLIERLATVLEAELGEKVATLYADKVPTRKRQEWIDAQVVKKKRRVLVCNPVCVQTGLNNLRYFNRLVWHENPACNPLTYRQTIGRIRRLGQAVATRSLFPYYAGTLQEQCYQLLMHKVGVSQSTDGLDPEAALRAVGAVEEDFEVGLSIGKQLYKLLTRGDEDREAA